MPTRDASSITVGYKCTRQECSTRYPKANNTTGTGCTTASREPRNKLRRLRSSLRIQDILGHVVAASGFRREKLHTLGSLEHPTNLDWALIDVDPGRSIYNRVRQYILSMLLEY